jgi:hypothetical protein
VVVAVTRMVLVLLASNGRLLAHQVFVPWVGPVRPVVLFFQVTWVTG